MILTQISKSLKKKFDVAKAASIYGQHESAKIGAAIFRKNEIISIGFNSYKTHTRFNHINSFSEDMTYVLHAEMAAILKARRSLDGCNIFVFREYKNGSMAMSRPCKACYNALKEAGIKYIYYTSSEGYNKERLN
jgi:deoxycytidylate deaminase